MTGDPVKGFIDETESFLRMCETDHGLWQAQLEEKLRRAIELLKATLPAPNPMLVPYAEIVAAYHKQLPMLAKVSKLTDQRRRQLARRWAEDKERQNISWWDRYFARGATSDFLTGARSTGRSDWKADFDFFLQPKSMIKILEGAYGITNARATGQSDYLASVRHEQKKRLERTAADGEYTR
jgi:hypothetical protein